MHDHGVALQERALVDEHTLRDLQSAIDTDRKNAGVSLRGPVLGLQRIVWVGIILSVFQQFVGINVIFYYSTSLWQSVGFDESDSFTISVVRMFTIDVMTVIRNDWLSSNPTASHKTFE